MIIEVIKSLDPESLDNNRHRHRHHHPKDGKSKRKMVKRIWVFERTVNRSSHNLRYRIRRERESEELKFWNRSHTFSCSVSPRPAFFCRIYRAVLLLFIFMFSLISITISSGTRTVIIYAPTPITRKSRSSFIRRGKSDPSSDIIYFILKMSVTE
jgi:hypothetical protein